MNNRNWNSIFERTFEAIEKETLKRFRRIAKIIDSAERRLKDAIEKFYSNLEAVDLPSARHNLSEDEIKEFREDVEKHYADAIAIGATSAWLKYLFGMRSRKRVSHIEAVNTHIQAAIIYMGAHEIAITTDALTASYQGAYYNTAYEIQRNLGLGWPINLLDDDMAKALRKRWGSDGELFSGRIWNNKHKMMATLESELKHSVMQGKDVQESIRKISKLMDTTKYNTERLIRTESAYYASLGMGEQMRNLGIVKYQIVATFDVRTSQICRDLDGKVYDMVDFEPGSTAPPFHPNCRTTTAPYDDDWDKIGTRAARNTNNKTTRISEDITYEQWYDKFVNKAD